MQFRQYTLSVGCEVLTVMVIESSIFLDITQCSPVKVCDVSEEHITSIFSVEKAFEPEYGGDMFFKNVR
jgi:hypothetical protein